MPVGPLQRCRTLGFTLVDLTGDEANRVAVLPLIHRDPFDRLLLAQAMVNDWALVSADEAILAYDTVTTVQADRA